jgi:WD40 repeat protein
VWDANTGTLLRTIQSRGVSSVALLPDGRQLLSGGYDNTLKLWDTATGSLLHTFEGHSDGVIRVAVSPDGRQLLSGSMDGTLRLWDTASGILLRNLEHPGWVSGVAFSPEGSRTGMVRSCSRPVSVARWTWGCSKWSTPCPRQQTP